MEFLLNNANIYKYLEVLAKQLLDIKPIIWAIVTKLLKLRLYD